MLPEASKSLSTDIQGMIQNTINTPRATGCRMLLKKLCASAVLTDIGHPMLFK